MSNGWKWVLWISGTVGAVVVCNWAANDFVEQDGRTRYGSPGAIDRPTVEAEEIDADLLVWRLCSDLIAGTAVADQMVAVYYLEDSEIGKHRRYKLRVVDLIRRLIDGGVDGPEGELLAHDLVGACYELRLADWER